MHKISKWAKPLLFVIIFFEVSSTLSSQNRWTFEFNAGTAANLPMPLTIKQEGYPEIKINARYYTEPFTSPIYWDWKIGKQKGKTIWEFEAIHHKLYLRNKTADIQQFSISHGFNLLFINRGFNYKGVICKAGVGTVLTHPENRIRNLKNATHEGLFGWGYYFSGPACNLAISKHFNLSKNFFINCESKITYAYARVPIANGHANVHNCAFHVAAGVGYTLGKQ